MGRKLPVAGAVLALAVLAAVAAALIARTGGLDTHIGSVPVRARSWERPAFLALALLILWLLARRRWLAAHSTELMRGIVITASLAAGAASLLFGTFTAGGADSYGYLSQARLLAQGRLTADAPPPPGFTWPDVPGTLTPLGYTRAAAPGALAPLYPPGLPLLMAPFSLIRGASVGARRRTAWPTRGRERRCARRPRGSAARCRTGSGDAAGRTRRPRSRGRRGGTSASR